MTNAGLVVAALAFAAALIKTASVVRPHRQSGRRLLFALLFMLAVACFAFAAKVQY